ncbi:enoyl-ACP reductase [soil metagenome]|jgi:enoyl-[acyl-carrier protein] reductase I
MYSIDLSEKKGLIFGLGNQRSVAWAIAERLHKAGAQMAFNYLNDKFKETISSLTADFHDPILVQCDVTKETDLDAIFSVCEEKFGKLDFVVHSVAHAPLHTFDRPFYEVSKEDWNIAMDASAYSLISMTRRARPLMTEGGSITAMSFLAGQRVVPKYKLMGIAKAALEANVIYLAYEMGPQNVRVNAISAGPLRTLSSRPIPGFGDMAAKGGRYSMMKRGITQEQVGGLALSLIADELGSGITGEVIYVDHGYHAMGMLFDEAELAK